MGSYQISFFNTLTNCYGQEFKACQRTIVVTAARDQARAIKAAKLRFARLEHVRNWHLHAQSFEVVAVGAPLLRCRQSSPARHGRPGSG